MPNSLADKDEVTQPMELDHAKLWSGKESSTSETYLSRITIWNAVPSYGQNACGQLLI